MLGAFGVGTVPTALRPVPPAVRRLVDRGVDVVVVTQHGGMIDLGVYANSKALRDAGAISGGKMRMEAALPKLMHALARFEDPTQRREWLQSDVAGEQE